MTMSNYFLLQHNFFFAIGFGRIGRMQRAQAGNVLIMEMRKLSN